MAQRNIAPITCEAYRVKIPDACICMSQEKMLTAIQRRIWQLGMFFFLINRIVLSFCIHGSQHMLISESCAYYQPPKQTSFAGAYGSF